MEGKKIVQCKMITCTNCETVHISESALACSDCGTLFE